jgi:hypothetical protein
MSFSIRPVKEIIVSPINTLTRANFLQLCDPNHTKQRNLVSDPIRILYSTTTIGPLVHHGGGSQGRGKQAVCC